MTPFFINVYRDTKAGTVHYSSEEFAVGKDTLTSYEQARDEAAIYEHRHGWTWQALLTNHAEAAKMNASMRVDLDYYASLADEARAEDIEDPFDDGVEALESLLENTAIERQFGSHREQVESYYQETRI